MPKGEREFVQWLRGRNQPDPQALLVPLGDDMGALGLSAHHVLVTSDMLMDGVDFRTAEHTPQQIGRKALAASLSDCAAMAARPAGVMVSVALPDGWTMEQAQGLYEGMAPLLAAYACPLIGGDTNSWPQPLVIDVTVLGLAYPGIAPVRRGGAKTGDGLYVSGPLGGSLLGRHLCFEPRVREARSLADLLGDDLHALIDISDGLALDGWRLCEASGVGLELDRTALERECIHADARSLSERTARPALEHALHDGEDFELLAACRRGDARLQTSLGSWWRIGEFVANGLWLRSGPTEREPLAPQGWEHFRSA